MGSSVVEGTSQAVLGTSNQRRVPASLSLFLESEKIPDQLCFTEENDLSTDPSPIYLQLPYYDLSSQDTKYIILRNVHILKKILFQKNQEKKIVKENEETFRIFLNVLLFRWESSKWSNQWNNYSTLKHWTCHVTTVIQVVDHGISYWLTLQLAQCNLICFGVAIWVPKIYLMHPTLHYIDLNYFKSISNIEF